MKQRIIIISLLFSLLMFGQENNPLNFCHSVFNEYSPAISFSGKQLLFETDESGSWRLAVAEKSTNNKWNIIRNIEEINSLANKNDFVGGACFSYNSDKILFTSDISGSKGDMDIWIADWDGTTAKNIKNIDSPINTDSYEGFPSLSPDGRSLYFMRAYPKKSGKRSKYQYKILVSEKIGENWSEPKELPEEINSGIVEKAKIMADGKTLVFSAIKEEGKGGFDFYSSEKDDLGKWSKAKNLSFANSKFNDKVYSVPASGDICFISNNEFESDDIYSIPIPAEYQIAEMVELELMVFDSRNDKLLLSSIEITNKNDSFIYKTETGELSVILEKDKIYNLRVGSFAYFTRELQISTIGTNDSTSIQRKIFLDPSQVNLSGNIVDAISKRPINAETVLENSDNASTEYSNSDTSGIYETSASIGNNYNFYAQKLGYLVSEKVFLDYKELKTYPDEQIHFELTPEPIIVSGKLYDEESQEAVEGRIIFENLTTGEIISISSNTEGKYKVELNKAHDFEYSTEAEGYFFASEKLGYLSNIDDKIFRKDIGLKALKVNAKIVLNNILFEFDSYELDQSSYKELNRVVDLLKSNPKIKLEISAHTDSKGADDYNQKLSKKRAASVVKYIAANGIIKRRLISRGLGESQPLVPNTTEENMAKNRRVEFKIIE